MRPGRSECGGLGDPGDADLAPDDLGRVGKPRRLGRQLLGREEADGNGKGAAERQHRRLVGFEIEREHAGNRHRAQVAGGKRAGGKRDQLVGANAALAADTERQGARHIDELAVAARRGLFVNPDGEPGIRRDRQGGEPGGAADQANRRAIEQGGGKALVMLRVGKPPAGRRIIEGDAEAGLARGGDGCRAAQEMGDGAGKRIGAMMATEQRHGRRAVFRHRHDRRVVRLVAEMGGERADDDPGGAQRNDRAAGAKGGSERCGAGQDLAAKPRRDRLGERRAGAGDNDHGRAAHHGAPPL